MVNLLAVVEGRWEPRRSDRRAVGDIQQTTEANGRCRKRTPSTHPLAGAQRLGDCYTLVAARLILVEHIRFASILHKGPSRPW